ncbi:MAG: hypothetical protein ABI780_14655, partial [Ardenticatenales bacterium]
MDRAPQRRRPWRQSAAMKVVVAAARAGLTRGASASAALALLGALAACRPNPAPTTTFPPITWPSPWPSATREPWPSATRGPSTMPAPSTTPVPTPTRTARPTVDPAAEWPVSMTLDEARSEARSWLDPKRQPRIEWAGYVARADLSVFVAGQACSTDELWRVGPAEGDEALPDMGIVVIASTRGLSMGLEESHGGSGAAIDACNSSAEARERIVALFDARTGRRLVVTMDYWMNVDVGVLWRTSTPPRVRSVPRPTASPTAPQTAATTAAPTTTLTLTAPTWPTPAGRPVDGDSVPPAFRDALRAYPLLPGSRWTWRAVSRYKGVAWQSSLLTETVEAAWLVAPDRLAVR